jgi:hypothetical protein
MTYGTLIFMDLLHRQDTPNSRNGRKKIEGLSLR